MNFALTRKSSFLHGFNSLAQINGTEKHVSPRLAAIYNETVRKYPSKCHQMISPLQAHFIAFIVSLVKPQRVLELGTFSGYSAAAIIHASPAIQLQCVELSKEYSEDARTNVPEATVHNMSCRQFIDEFKGERFDLCFVDADKQGYEEYHQGLVRGIIKSGGIIMYDNVLFRDQAIHRSTEIGRSLNEFVERRLKESAILLPAFDGMLLFTCK